MHFSLLELILVSNLVCILTIIFTTHKNMNYHEKISAEQYESYKDSVNKFKTHYEEHLEKYKIHYEESLQIMKDEYAQNINRISRSYNKFN